MRPHHGSTAVQQYGRTTSAGKGPGVYLYTYCRDVFASLTEIRGKSALVRRSVLTRSTVGRPCALLLNQTLCCTWRQMFPMRLRIKRGGDDGDVGLEDYAGDLGMEAGGRGALEGSLSRLKQVRRFVVPSFCSCCRCSCFSPALVFFSSRDDHRSRKRPSVLLRLVSS